MAKMTGRSKKSSKKKTGPKQRKTTKKDHVLVERMNELEKSGSATSGMVQELRLRFDDLISDLRRSRAFEKPTSREQMQGGISDLKGMLLEALTLKLSKAVQRENLDAADMASEITSVEHILGLRDSKETSASHQ